MRHPAPPESHIADAAFRPGQDHVPADSVGNQIPFTPDELNEAERYEDDPPTSPPVVVTIKDRVVPTAERACHDWSVNQVTVGAQGAQSVVQQIVGADPARRSITITNVGAVPICIGPSLNLSPSSAFVLTNGATDPLAGASLTIPYRGAIFAMLYTGTTVGQIQFSAVGEDS